jgi:hypothetical protein
MRPDHVIHRDQATDAGAADIARLLASAYLRLKHRHAANHQQDGQLQTDTDCPYIAGSSAARVAYIVMAQHVNTTEEEAP